MGFLGDPFHLLGSLLPPLFSSCFTFDDDSGLFFFIYFIYYYYYDYFESQILISIYPQGAVCVIVFSLNDPDMENAIRKWLHFISIRHGRPLLSVILVGTHADLESEVFSFCSYCSFFVLVSYVPFFQTEPDCRSKQGELGRYGPTTLQRLSMYSRKGPLLCR